MQKTESKRFDASQREERWMPHPSLDTFHSVGTSNHTAIHSCREERRFLPRNDLPHSLDEESAYCQVLLCEFEIDFMACSL